MNELALFAGAGGGLLGSKLLGWRTVCYVENDAYCVQVIQQRIRDGMLDDAPIWDDVRTFDGKPWAGCVDIVTGGFPCQPWSVAGKRAVEADERNLWPDTIRIITLAEFMKNTRGAQPWLKIVRKRSEELVEADVTIPLDLVFIDGDHSYEAVNADFQRISPWLSREGTIAFHDSLYYAGVARTIGEALVTGEWAVTGCVGNLCWIKRAEPNRAGGELTHG